MTEQLTPDAAREALASVQKMTTAGRRVGSWPRWAHIAEAVVMAVMLTTTGVIGPKWPDVLIVLGMGLLGVALRYYFVARFGVFPKLDWVDGVLALASLAVVFVVAFTPRALGLPWLAWVIGPAFALLCYWRTEYVRSHAPRVEGA